VLLQTLQPTYGVNLVMSGAFKSRTLTSDETRDPTRYLRPFDADPWDSTNADDDFATEDREDYTVTIPDDGLQLGSGVTLGMFQEALQTFHLSGESALTFQIEITNTTGRVRLQAIRLDSVQGRNRRGILT
jgi:hypothetical protein